MFSVETLLQLFRSNALLKFSVRRLPSSPLFEIFLSLLGSDTLFIADARSGLSTYGLLDLTVLRFVFVYFFLD
jgi:hypothetical protein